MAVSPTQPFALGVTIMFPIIAFEVALVEVNGVISAEPEAPKPIATLSFVQSN